jgi:hypothetical protein
MQGGAIDHSGNMIPTNVLEAAQVLGAEGRKTMGEQPTQKELQAVSDVAARVLIP